MTPRSGAALATLAAALYAVCYVAIKAGLAFAPPFRFAALRAAVAGVALLVVVAGIGQPLLPPRRLWPGVFVLAAVATTVGFGAMFLSPGRSGAGIASVLGNTTPLFVIVLAAFVLKEPVTRTKGFALATGLVGTAVVALGGPSTGRSGMTAALLPLIAAAAIATENVVVKRLAIGDAVLRVAAWQLLIGSVPLFLASAWLEANTRVVWAPIFVGLVAVVAVLSTAVATSLWYWLVAGDEVGRLSLYLFLIPVLGLALGAALFRERLSLVQIAGVGITLIGIAWAMRDSLRQPAPTEGQEPPLGAPNSSGDHHRGFSNRR